ncbi:MAG: preprotein translocase subunit SecG [Pseudomonadales bacterium]|uniref:Protein-export membrane protein SecG n=1 Tax=Microvirgula aerodenitrificans TaxID=57480 RepID=A0A2S0P7I9_9NEIS|nr:MULTISPECIES: preprotein translocase subunit SecG [Microvirgula]AVY93291.1 preprotein translocase subunit SecG [Microvirgula aerodenitrificans]RAS19795.1 protein translocase subunit secG [Microvirgula sp. AG722]
MEILKTLIWIVNLISAFAVIVLVLMQHGKGADMGAAFGSGASGSLFGATGSANFLSRTTAVLSTIFFATCLALVLLSSGSKQQDLGVMAKPIEQTVAPSTAPAGATNNQNPVQNGKIPD